jgi:membrane-associated phospholipid phosphatase
VRLATRERRRVLPRLPGRDPEKRRRHPVLRALADLDQAALRTLRTRLHGPAPDAVMKSLGAAGEWAAVWVAISVGAAAADHERRSRWLTTSAVGPAAIGLNFAFKVAVGRKRPLLEEHPPLARAPTKLSFPSSHATSSVAAATAMGRVRPGARPAVYGLAAAICLSRPYLGMHYPSDVLAGAVLGTLIGRAVPGLDGDRPAATGGAAAEPAPSAPPTEPVGSPAQAP